MQNGFFHERPTDYDIYVADNMVAQVGAKQINWHVENATTTMDGIFATVSWNNNIYTAILRTFGADHYWMIIA